MARVSFNHMDVVNNYSAKANIKEAASESGNCYTCDSSDCDGGWCDCNDGGSDE